MTTLFRLITFLGNEEFYLFLLPLIYWCVDRQGGVRLGYLSLSSAWLNDAIKYLFALPRPSDARIQVLVKESSPSFPSGHAQGAAVNWGYLAHRFPKKLFAAIALSLILAISFSRIVVGVHYPQDVIGGWLVGLIVLATCAWIEPGASRWLQAQKPALQLALALGIPLLLILLHPADTHGLYPAKGAVTPMGAMAGFGVAILMERWWLRFQVDGVWWKRGLRFLAGLIIAVALYLKRWPTLLRLRCGLCAMACSVGQ